MRVLHVLAPASHPGGLERVVATLAAGQARAGARVHVAIVGGGASPEAIGVAGIPGVTPHVLDLPSRAYWKELAAIEALCATIRPAVVHTHGYRPDVIAAAAARRAAAPVVSTVHGFTGGSLRNRLYEQLQRRALRRCDAVVVVSRPLREHLLASGVPSHRLHLVPNACERPSQLPRADARDALGCPGAEFTIGWIGRLSREKGADVLVDALALVPDLPVRIVVMGDGPELRWLRGRAGASGIAEKILWRGVVPEASRYLSALDLLVSSSRTEGSPMVVLEAMAAAVPIVATDVGGVAHQVGPRGARLVPPENAKALAAAIREAWASRDATVALGRAAQERYEEYFRVEPWVATYRHLYATVSAPAAAA